MRSYGSHRYLSRGKSDDDYFSIGISCFTITFSS